LYPDPDKGKKTSAKYRDDSFEGHAISGSGEDIEKPLTFQNLLLTTKRPKRGRSDKFSFEHLITASDSSQSADYERRIDAPPSLGGHRGHGGHDGHVGHGHFVYLPRDDLVPRFEEQQPAPGLGIGFDDWLSESAGISEAPKDFVGSSVFPKRRKRRSA
jgi:hypothetical protein